MTNKGEMKLTLTEVEEMLAKVVYQYILKAFKTKLLQVDADKDGKLKYDEFVKLFVEN